MEECRGTYRAAWFCKESVVVLRHEAFEPAALEGLARAALPPPEDRDNLAVRVLTLLCFFLFKE